MMIMMIVETANKSNRGELHYEWYDSHPNWTDDSTDNVVGEEERVFLKIL
jgi:hypothetical protein